MSHASVASVPGKLNTKSLFNVQNICWRVLGMLPPQRLRPLYWLYSFVINVVFIVSYPLHLLVGLFHSRTMYEVLQNLSINIICVVCVMKSYAIWWQFKTIAEMLHIIERQDGRIHSTEDMEHMKKRVYPPVLRIIKVVAFLCLMVGITAETAVIVNGLLGNWRLMYQGNFPFDPFESTWNYIIAHVYQAIGLTYICFQQTVNDTIAPCHLALMTGQVRMLGLRVAKIGYDMEMSTEENNRELLECIQGHKDLLEHRDKLEKVLSWYMFIQILLASINMCIGLVFVVLFVPDPFTFSYYFVLLIGLVFEILPSCYYGTLLEDEFQNLTYALFSCNWMDQDVVFKKNLRIFAEKASRRIYVTAWLFRINNNSFIIAYKNTYSLFAVIMNMK